MKRVAQSGPGRVPRGFTLIEMLVVMAIIAVLMGLVFPAVRAVQTAARRARAEQQIQSIVTALTAYRTAYGKYPLQDEGQDFAYRGTHPVHGDLYVRLWQVLRSDATWANLDQWNPRRHVFLEVAEQMVVQGRLKDPWGEDFHVAVDGNFDNRVDGLVMNGHGTVTNAVAVWSSGQSRRTGLNPADRRDDVTSWAR